MGGGEGADKNKNGREPKGDEVVAGPNKSNPGRHTHTYLEAVNGKGRKIRNHTLIFGGEFTTASLLLGRDGLVSSEDYVLCLRNMC